MGIQNIALIVISILLAALSFYVFLRNPKEPICRSFFVMVFGAAVWVFSNSLDYIYKIFILTKFTYLGALLVIIGFLYFSFYFPFRNFIIKKLYHVLILFPAIVLIITLYFTNMFIKGVNEDYSKITFGIFYYIFNFYFLFIWIWGVNNFIKKYKVAYGLHKWQIKNIFFGLFFSFIAGIVTNLLLPWIFDIWTLSWIGPLFAIITFGFLTYILFKKNIKHI